MSNLAQDLVKDSRKNVMLEIDSCPPEQRLNGLRVFWDLTNVHDLAPFESSGNKKRPEAANKHIKCWNTKNLYIE